MTSGSFLAAVHGSPADREVVRSCGSQRGSRPHTTDGHRGALVVIANGGPSPGARTAPCVLRPLPRTLLRRVRGGHPRFHPHAAPPVTRGLKRRARPRHRSSESVRSFDMAWVFAPASVRRDPAPSGGVAARAAAWPPTRVAPAWKVYGAQPSGPLSWQFRWSSIAVTDPWSPWLMAANGPADVGLGVSPR